MVCQNSHQAKKNTCSTKKRDNKDLSKLKETKNETMNPIDESLNKDFLLNIKTGIKINFEVDQYLLNIFGKGAEKQDKFISECKKVAKALCQLGA